MFGVVELTFRKILQPAFIIMLIIAVLFGYFISEVDPLAEQGSATSLIAQLSSAEKGAPVLSSTLFALVVTALMAVFMGAGEIPRDIDSEMIFLVIAKPITKFEYLMGKYIGLLAMCFTFFLAIELTVLVGHYVQAGEFYPFNVMVRQLLSGFLIFPLCALVTMISCFMQDISAMIVSAMYIIISVVFSTVPLYIAVLPDELRKAVSFVYFFYYFFPNLIYYFQTFRIFGLVSISLIVYSLTTALIFILIATNHMKKRDLV